MNIYCLTAVVLAAVAGTQASRVAEATGDPFRPFYHFTAARDWINDPNGLVYFKGEWHLGYQTLWPRHWGHAVSSDLVHWKERPLMLSPDSLGQIYSGGAVVDRDDTTGFFGGKPGLVAIFTYDKAPTQYIGLAFSTDDGVTWEKYAGNPVLREEGMNNFRDPKVFWHEVSKRWVMILTGGDRARIYSSPDMKTWEFKSTFGGKDGAQGYTWECPDLFPIQTAVDGKAVTKWVLTGSYLTGENFKKPYGYGTCEEQYFVGEFDGHHFRNDNPPGMVLRSSYGDDYAAIIWSDAPADRRVAIGWMSHWGYANQAPTKPWKGTMTLPRELSLEPRGSGSSLRLIQRPVVELQTLREAARTWPAQRLLPDENPMEGERSAACEIIADFELGDATEVGLRVRRGDSQETVIGYRRLGSEVFVDRSRSGATDFHPRFAEGVKAPLVLADGKVRLHVFLDQSSIEVFANDGEVFMPALIFPGRESNGLAAYALGGAAKLNALTLHPLKKAPVSYLAPVPK